MDFVHEIVFGNIGETSENKGDEITMSYDENPNDNDPHGECESEIRYLAEMLESVDHECENHRAADRGHCLSPSLLDQIQGYLQATGRRSGVAAGSPVSESDEEIHQRRRREQMLDEVTLTLIAGGLNSVNCTMDEFGCGIRQSSRKLCDGINEADAQR